MTTRARKLIGFGLAGIGVLAAGTFAPFGQTDPHREVRPSDVAEHGYSTGREAAEKLAPAERAKFGHSPERLARFVAERNGIAQDVREQWCAEFARGFRQRAEMRARAALPVR